MMDGLWLFLSCLVAQASSLSVGAGSTSPTGLPDGTSVSDLVTAGGVFSEHFLSD